MKTLRVDVVAARAALGDAAPPLSPSLDAFDDALRLAERAEGDAPAEAAAVAEAGAALERQLRELLGATQAAADAAAQ